MPVSDCMHAKEEAGSVAGRLVEIPVGDKAELIGPGVVMCVWT